MKLPGFNTYLPAWANQNWAFRQIISTVTWYCTITTPSPNKVYNTEKSVTNRVTVCPVAWPQLTVSFTPCETTLLWNQLQHSQYAARNKVLQYLFQSRTAPDVLFVDKILLPSVQLTATKPVHKYPKNTYSFFCSRDHLNINLEMLLLIREALNGTHSHKTAPLNSRLYLTNSLQSKHDLLLRWHLVLHSSGRRHIFLRYEWS